MLTNLGKDRSSSGSASISSSSSSNDTDDEESLLQAVRDADSPPSDVNGEQSSTVIVDPIESTEGQATALVADQADAALLASIIRRNLSIEKLSPEVVNLIEQYPTSDEFDEEVDFHVMDPVVPAASLLQSIAPISEVCPQVTTMDSVVATPLVADKALPVGSEVSKPSYLNILDSTQETVIVDPKRMPGYTYSYGNMFVGGVERVEHPIVEDGRDLLQPRVFGNAWNSARSTLSGYALSQHEKKFEESKDVVYKTRNGQEIRIPKLMDLEHLDRWLHLLQNSKRLLSQVLPAAEVERILHPHVTISSAAKMAISANYTNTSDVHTMSAEEIMTVLKRANEYHRKPVRLIDVLDIVKEKLKTLRTWKYDPLYTKQTCVEWVTNIWTIIYNAVHSAGLKTNERALSKVFLGCLEPTTFRQHIVLAIHMCMTSTNNTVDTFTGPLVVSWDSTFSIVGLTKAEALQVDSISDKIPRYFEALGTSSEHQSSYRLLPVDVQAFAKSIFWVPYDKSKQRDSSDKSKPKAKRPHADSDSNSSKKQKLEAGSKNKSQPSDSKSALRKSTKPELPCILCEVVGHKARACPTETCFPGCSKKPSDEHDPWNCPKNPRITRRSVDKRNDKKEDKKK